MDRKKEFEELKKKSLHDYDSLLPLFIIDPITTRLVYFIKKRKIKITPNQISVLRLFIFYPIIVILLLIAPLFSLRVLYLVVAILTYLALITDGLDGQLARALDKKSKKGFFLDLIGDRCNIIIFILFVFSVGAFLGSRFLVYGAVLIFVLKMFHMMVITKIYYIDNEEKSNEEAERIFGPNNALNAMGINRVYGFIAKINKVLKLKRWNGDVAAGPERYVITIILPSILLFFGVDKVVLYAFYIFTILFALFFMIRIKDLLKENLDRFEKEERAKKKK